MRPLTTVVGAASRHGWLWRHRSDFSSCKPAQKPRLLVDVSAIIRHDAQTGIQRVVRAVWLELSRRSGRDFDVVPVYATTNHGYCYAPLGFLERNGSRLRREAVRLARGDKFLGLDLSAHLLPKYRRQVRAWRANGATVHLIVYDLLPLLQPDWFSRAACGHFRKWFEFLAEEADQAICISDQVARDLRQLIKKTPADQRLAVGRLHLGGDIAASAPTTGVSPAVAELLDRLRFRPAILMVGTVEPRKAYDVALAAFEHLWQSMPSQAPDLVIIGKGGWKTARLQQQLRSHVEHGKRLFWLDGVSDEALCQFYSGCRGLFMASRGEGFGLPLIEAAMYGRPMLARDLPVFRGQSLSNISFFDDDRPESLAARLMDLVGQDHGAPRADTTLPAWAECVSRLLDEIGANEEPGGPQRTLRVAS